jgi:hypothetical protein
MTVTIFHRFPSRNLSKIVMATGRRLVQVELRGSRRLDDGLRRRARDREGDDVRGRERASVFVQPAGPAVRDLVGEVERARERRVVESRDGEPPRRVAGSRDTWASRRGRAQGDA